MYERIDYRIEERAAIFDRLASEGKAVIHDVSINLVNEVPTLCFCMVVGVIELED